jgi:hypothetical protein
MKKRSCRGTCLKPPVVQPCHPILLVAAPVTAETAAPTPKYLSGLECRQLLTLPVAQYIPKLLLPSQGFCHGVATLMALV